MNYRKWCISIILLIVGIYSAHASIEAATRKEKGLYITEGYIDLPEGEGEGWRVLRDFPGYDSWALRGLDGKDPVSAKYLGLFSSLVYSGPGMMTLGFDVNLPWPFGSKGNKTEFRVRNEESPDSGRLVFCLAKPNFATKSVDLEIFGEEKASPGRLRYRLSIRFSWFLEPFFSLQGYKEGVEWRIHKVVGNFEEYCAQGSKGRALTSRASTSLE
jgi:hypothetical protein